MAVLPTPRIVAFYSGTVATRGKNTYFHRFFGIKYLLYKDNKIYRIFACNSNNRSMDILTNTISLLFRPRQKEIARFAQDADAIQHKQLKSLLSTARNTEWGLKHDYKSIQGYADFCERIPLQTYDDIKPYVTRMINGERNILWPSVVRWYAKSSGTTNDKSKFLPSQPEILKG